MVYYGGKQLRMIMQCVDKSEKDERATDEEEL